MFFMGMRSFIVFSAARKKKKPPISQRDGRQAFRGTTLIDPIQYNQRSAFCRITAAAARLVAGCSGTSSETTITALQRPAAL